MNRDGAYRRQLVQLGRGVQRPGDHMRAVAGEGARHGKADAAAGPSDNSGLSGEIDLHHAYKHYGYRTPADLGGLTELIGMRLSRLTQAPSVGRPYGRRRECAIRP